ncbi:zinc ribbon domain-containing protein [Candidatus Woesearchaeota archaeon]|nr:zinc ribbon domain-containing protein [Candidatus Woesearchaeota archaeon]
MPDQKLADFIKKALKTGVSLSSIRSQLKTKGWPDKQIDDSVQLAMSQNIPEPQPIHQDVPPPKPEPSTPKAYCWNCGTENDTTAKACKNCGSNLSDLPREVKGRDITKIAELSFQKQSRDYRFSTSIKGSALPIETFLDRLREKLSDEKVLPSQAKIKTGEMDTKITGMTFSGFFGNRRYGAATASSNVYTNTWNPFDITYVSEQNALFGKFKGRIKINEQAKYHKKGYDTEYELEDYALSGNISFEPSIALMFLSMVFGIVLSFIIHTGFWAGFGITLGFMFIIGFISMSIGDKELKAGIPQDKIKTAILKLEKHLQQQSETMFNS